MDHDGERSVVSVDAGNRSLGEDLVALVDGQVGVGEEKDRMELERSGYAMMRR